MKRAQLHAFPRRSFMNSADCPHCSRSYFIAGSAPVGDGHRPHYFSCECGRKIMAVVPAGAQVESVQSSWYGSEKQREKA